MTASAPSSHSRWNAAGWTALHDQVCALLEMASTDDDYFVAVRRRFGGRSAPGIWEAVATGPGAGLHDVVENLRLPPTVSSLGVVTWATARRVTPSGFDDAAAWIAIVTTDARIALSATVTVGSEVLWTPYPTGRLAESCQAAFVDRGDGRDGEVF